MSKKRLASNIIRTVELCLRMSEDEFNNRAILRVDVGSDCFHGNGKWAA